jgi:hypothetical protein
MPDYLAPDGLAVTPDRGGTRAGFSAYSFLESDNGTGHIRCDSDVDTPLAAPIKSLLEQGASAFDREESAVTLIKIIIITLVVILSILFLGRVLF